MSLWWLQTTSDFTLQQGQGCHLGFLAGVVGQQVNGLGRAALCAAEAKSGVSSLQSPLSMSLQPAVTRWEVVGLRKQLDDRGRGFQWTIWEECWLSGDLSR